MRIVMFGTFDERAHPRVGVLRQGLAAHGHEVIVVNRPLAFDTAARVRLAAEPWRAVGFAARVLVAWIRLLWASRAVARPDAVVVGYLGAFDVHLAKLRFRSSTIVLDEMVRLGDTVRDRDAGSASTSSILDRLDRAARRRADIVVCDTDEQAATAADPAVVVAHVGAGDDWFNAAVETPPAPPLRVIFFGLYTPFQGAAIIGEALARVGADVPIECTMVGTGQERAATEAAASGAAVSITWLDWVESHALPALVAAHHVCLGVFGDGDKAHRVVPTKVYQGAAAGCAVVTGDLDAQRRVVGAGATFVPPGDAVALAEALTALALDPDALAAARASSVAWAAKRASPLHVTLSLHERLISG